MTAPPRGRVLLVEDSEDDALIVGRAFRRLKLGHELRVASTGEAALELLALGAWRPHVMFLDINLPGLSGLEVLRRVKADPRQRGLPVVMLSASDREADVRDALSAGAEHYYVKPIHFEAFVQLLRDWNEAWTRTGRFGPA